VVQLYVMHPQNPNVRTPICALKGFQRIHLDKGESRKVSFTLTPEELGLVDQEGNLVEKAGKINLYIGGGQPYKSEGDFSSVEIQGDNYTIY